MKGARVESRVFNIRGMDCADCAAHVEKAVGALPGVSDARVHFATARLRVVYDASLLPENAVTDRVRSLGYSATGDAAPRAAAGLDRRAAAAALAAALTACGFVAAGLHWPVVSTVAFAAALVAGGAEIARRGVIALFHRALDMNFLMSVAALGAVLIGEWSEGATAMSLFAIAQWLEGRSMDRARRAIREVLSLAPDDALVRRGGREERVAVATIAVGETIVVAPGERVALDGLVVSGHSAVDQSPITGEPLPVPRAPGDAVFAGSVNTRGSLEIEVTRGHEDTTLAGIIHRVEEAQASRAPSERFVDRFARRYTPVVIGLALLVAVVPPVFFARPFEPWLYRALVLLVISCPCALVLSTPISIVSALAAAARGGVLIKGGAHLEAIARVQGVAFDKTGTLTRGRPRVAGVVASDGADPDRVLVLAASIEVRSEHPLAHAILSAAADRGLALEPVGAFESTPGAGAEAVIAGRRYRVGSPRWLGAASAPAGAPAGGDERTHVVVAGESGILGTIAIGDEVRPESEAAVAALRRSGIRTLALLTGDEPAAARAVAEALGLDEWRAGLLPAEKAQAVKDLESRRGPFAMVGDGVNDAPALAAASVGVAMGTAGTDAALEVADIALMSDDLGHLAPTVRLAKDTMRIIRQNIAFSLATKAVFLGLALAGAATLWMAVAADMGASLLVIFNGLRLARRSPARYT